MVRLDYLYFGCDSIEESGSLSLKRNTIFEELEKKIVIVIVDGSENYKLSVFNVA